MSCLKDVFWPHGGVAIVKARPVFFSSKINETKLQSDSNQVLRLTDDDALPNISSQLRVDSCLLSKARSCCSMSVVTELEVATETRWNNLDEPMLLRYIGSWWPDPRREVNNSLWVTDDSWHTLKNISQDLLNNQALSVINLNITDEKILYFPSLIGHSGCGS